MDGSEKLFSSVPIAAQFTSALSFLRNTLAGQSALETTLTKIIPNAVKRDIANDNIRLMGAKIETINTYFDYLQNGNDFTSQSNTSLVHNIHSELSTIVNQFVDRNAILRQYPPVAVKILFALAPVIAIFHPILKAIVPALADKTQIACNFYVVLYEYRTLAAEFRMSKTKIFKTYNQMSLDGDYIRDNRFAIDNVIQKPYNELGYSDTKMLKCDMDDCSIIEFCLTDLVSNKEFGTRSSSNHSSPCNLDYLGLIRHRIEQSFQAPMELVSKTCSMESEHLRRTGTSIELLIGK